MSDPKFKEATDCICQNNPKSYVSSAYSKYGPNLLFCKNKGDSLVVALLLWPLKFQGIEDSITTEHGERYSKH